MNEFLIIRLSNQTKTELIWWIWSPLDQSVVRQGTLSSVEEIETLREEGLTRKVILLISAADISLKSVTLPSARIRHLEKVIPYLVEEEFSEDVEHLHFSILNRVGQEAWFAAIDKRWMFEMITRFTSAGLEPVRLIPDVLALPSDSVNMVNIGDEWLIHQGPYSGVSIEAAWLPFYLSRLMEDDEGQTPEVHLYSTLPDGVTEIPDHWVREAETSVLKLLSDGAVNTQVNLLSGEFRPKSSFSLNWLIWKKCAIACAALVCISIIYSIMNVHVTQQKTQALQAENKRIFHQIFPDKKKIPTTGYLKRQFDDELARLNGGTSQNSVINTFALIANALGNQGNIQIQELSFDGSKGDIRLNLQGKDFSAFEAARKSLEKTFTVQQGPLNKANNAVSGTYTLRQR